MAPAVVRPLGAAALLDRVFFFGHVWNGNQGAGHVCRARNLIGREPWPEEKHKNSKFCGRAPYWAPANGVGKPLNICVFIHEIVKPATTW